MSEVQITLDFGVLGERTVLVEYKYSPGRPGRMYMPNGDPGYPDDPPEVDIIKVTSDDLTAALRDVLEDYDPLFEAIGEQEAEYAVADADQRYRELEEERLLGQG